MPNAIIADARQLVDLTADIRALARRIASRAARQATSQSAERPRFVARLVEARARRAAVFPGVLFGEPAWDMLLNLYVAQAENRIVTVSSLCQAAHVPFTTALRSLGGLVYAGYVQRQADRGDGRRVLTTLTDTGQAALDAWIEDAVSLGLA